MLRIISGKYRHMIIATPNVNTTRPTTDKVREALMSALGDKLINSTILDLFAGSGALGLESLSRGAKKAIFCDNNYLAYKTIKDNILKLKIEEETEVHKCSYQQLLNTLNEKIDIVYLDPPYAKIDLYQIVTDFLIKHQLLNKDAIVVKECNKELPFDERFSYHKRYQYGTIHVLIERK